MFSIIVPIHNSEKTLEKCLDSVRDQTYTDFEAILVENGSSDGSYAICQAYEKSDPRFKAFRIGACNGPSKARNFGLDHAAGEYIAFLDSDDQLDADFLKMLAENFRGEVDAVFFGFHHENTDGTIIETKLPQIHSKSVKEQAMQLKRQDCFGYTWCKAFRHAAIGSVRFDEAINLFEDEVFTLDVLGRCRNVISVPDGRGYYCYTVDNAASLMRQTHLDIVAKKDAQFQAWKRFLGDEFREEWIDLANESVLFCRFYAYEHGFELKKSYFQIIHTEFYKVAGENPSPFTRKHFGSLRAYKLDWLFWKVKQRIRR